MGAVNAIEIRYFLEELDRKLMKKRKKMNATTFFTFPLFLPCLKYQTYISGLIEQKKYCFFFIFFLSYLVRRAFLLKARKFLVTPPQ